MKNPVTWQAGEHPISSAKLNQMTLDWVRNGSLILDSSGCVKREWQTTSPTNPYYLGWYPYSAANHVWNNLVVEGMLSHTGTSTLQYGFRQGGGSTSWYDVDVPTSWFGYSTGFKIVYNTLFDTVAFPATFTAGWIGFRLSPLPTWDTTAYFAWVFRAYLTLSTQPPW